jgi:MFS family permease
MDSEVPPVDEKTPLTVKRISGFGRGFGYQVVVLLCISFLSFGSYFSYDSISALEAPLTHELGISQFQYGLFFSIYAFPNIVLVIFGGILIDKIGNRKSAVLFCSLIAVGTLIVATAPLLQHAGFTATSIFPAMLFGRFIFGLGAESSYVVQNSMAVEWFSGPHLSKAMAITVTVSRLGSILAFNVESKIANYFGSYSFALWFAFITCAFSLCAVVFYVFLDIYAKRKFNAKPSYASLNEANKSMASVIESDKNASQVLDNTVVKEISYFKKIHQLGLMYWLCLAIAVTIYTTIFVFLAQTSKYIAEKWNYTNDQANFYISLIDITSLVISPIFGWIVDSTGKKGWLVLVGNVIAVIGYIVIGQTNLPAPFGIALLGLHFALMPSAMWPAVSAMAPPELEGLSFALVSAFLNAALAAAQPLAGYIADTSGLEGLCTFFASVSGLSVVLAIIWNIADMRQRTPVLNVVVASD